jgi:hypothetical protein
VDYLVLASGPGMCLMLEDNGWELGGSDFADSSGDPSAFRSYTKAEVNLIVTCSLPFFNKFMAATSVCKRLNLMSKPDRIAVFRAVLYGEACEPTLDQLNAAADALPLSAMEPA